MKLVLAILGAAIITAFISGVFGMAGGMILMGFLVTIMGVAEAMVVHGALQAMSNSSRALFLRRDIRWDILGWILLGAFPSILLLALAQYVPQKGVLFIVLGLLPFLLWLPRGWLQGDASNPPHAILCGFLIMALNLVAGAAGPALDIFFVKTKMSRQEIVATKAVTMFGSHSVKIVFFGLPLILASGMTTLPPLWLFVIALPCVLIGTWAGTRLLYRFSDIGFRSATQYLVTVIGVVYLFRGAVLLGWIAI